jgi:hypothetical protein
MNGSSEITQAGRLVLARLLVAGDKGATTGEISKALAPYVGHRWAGAALAEQLARQLADLAAARLVARTRKGKTERATITPEGRRQALAFLGIDELPQRATWSQITKTYLAACALGLPAPREKAARNFGGDPGFKAALLTRQFALPIDAYPTLDQALDALAWKLLGFEAAPGVKLTVKSIKAALVRRELDGSTQIDPRADPRKEATKLLAQKVGARQSSKDELRQAAIRRWVDGALAMPAPAPISAAVPAPSPSLDLDTFAQRVLEAARASPTGWFGDNKVFVVHVFRALSHDPVFAAMGLDGFKQRLAEANNARRLDLGRADMVEAMDREEVALSRVSYLGAEYHFVRV